MWAVKGKSNEKQLQNNIQTVSGRNLIVELQFDFSFLKRFYVGKIRCYDDEVQFQLVWEKIEDNWNLKVRRSFNVLDQPRLETRSGLRF